VIKYMLRISKVQRGKEESEEIKECTVGRKRALGRVETPA
jgi:hypothetical protein